MRSAVSLTEVVGDNALSDVLRRPLVVSGLLNGVDS